MATAEGDGEKSVDWESEAKKLRFENRKLNELLAKERDQHADKQKVCELEFESTVQDLEHRLSIANERIRKLEIEQAGMEVVREENRRLSETVFHLQEEISDLMEKHAVESHTIKKETFHSRIQLETTFRKTLQEMDKKHHEKAFQEMDQESKTALIEKARVQEELALQTIGIEALTKRYQEQSKTVQTLKTDKSILKEHQLAQTKKIALLKQEVVDLSNTRTDLQEKLDEVSKQVATVEEMKERLSTALAECNELRQGKEEAESKANKYKDRLAKAMERLKALEKLESKKKKASNFAANEDLLRALTNIAKPESGNQHHQQQQQQQAVELNHSITYISKMPRKVSMDSPSSKSMRESYSMPALRKSDYPGILETWNAKFAQERRKNGS